MKKDLRENLARQRRWREPKPIKSGTKQPRSKTVLFTVIIIAAVVIIMIFTATYKDSPVVVSAPTEIRKVKATSSPVSTTLTVCTGNLHVRFMPEGDIRGYLREGEQIIVAVNGKNQPVTEEKNNNTWILIAAPVEGWANTKFLCEQKGDKND